MSRSRRRSFAEHQYDMLGEANVTAEGNLADVIDLFGWSGSTGSAKWGMSISDEEADYSGEFVDWGKNIGNGTTWRTLTYNEWYYVRYRRENADSLVGVARILLSDSESVNGLILLPDTWTCPQNVIFKSGFADEWSREEFANHQIFTLSEWQTLEKAGAVFFPASGEHFGTSMSCVLSRGCYASATAKGDCASLFSFRSNEAAMAVIAFYAGVAVRLVRDVK
ncbi:MAG: hypothetical protein ACI30A_02510 [Paludibacteraceae bacterium]